MHIFLNFFGFVWCLPLSIFVWLLGLFLGLVGQVDKFLITKNLEFVFLLNEDGFFFKKLFLNRGFFGFSFGNCIFFPSSISLDSKLYKHESRHVNQCYVFGVFFPVVYIIHSIFIYFFIKEKHAYYDNLFELDARKFAGQLVVIPKRYWDNDRWLFW